MGLGAISFVLSLDESRVFPTVGGNEETSGCSRSHTHSFSRD